MLYWDPSKALLPWDLPFLGRPVLWYGFLFALGFLLAYRFLVHLLREEMKKEQAKKIADSLTFYVILGTIIGARLFDVLFYENWNSDFWSVFKVWEGGLASHGGVLGMIAALALFQRKHRFCSFYHLIDLLVLPAAILAFFIRIGNFINQEILGKPSNVPWAVTFGHPADGSFPVPRHPVQLYEAFYYLAVFIGLWALRKRWKHWKAGRACGLFLVLIFVFRFFVEFFKEEQSPWLIGSPLSMGQLLSVPFILFGLYLLFRKKS
jgi:phosphatidylglycerol---prolipoprotein diacylglyceryl transferase